MSPVAPDSALDKFALLALLLALGVPASGCRRAPDRVSDSDLSARAERLAQEILILDTHVDLPGRLHEKMEDVSTRTAGGNFDYPRARAGGLKAAFMAIFVASAAQKPGEAVQQADALIDMMERVAAHSSAKFSIARSPAEIRRNLERGRFSLALGLENGVALEGDLRNLDHFYRRGVRYITLAHSENNDLADSSFAPGPKWHGLSPFGRRAVSSRRGHRPTSPWRAAPPVRLAPRRLILSPDQSFAAATPGERVRRGTGLSAANPASRRVRPSPTLS